MLGLGKLIVKTTWGGVRDASDTATVAAALVPDVDLQAVCFADNGVAIDACYWNRHIAASGALKHGGDEKQVNAGEDLVVNLGELPLDVCAVSFSISSFLPTMPLARLDDLVITIEYVPAVSASSTTPPQHVTLFPQFNETTCRPGLIGAVGHIARVGKQLFELHQYGDGVLVPGNTFVDAIPMLRELAKLPAPSAFMSQISIPINLHKGETNSAFTPTVGGGWKPVAGVAFNGSLCAGVGWDVAARGAEAVDIDLSAIILDNDFNIIHRVFWGELDGFNKAIEHHGDNETGEDSDGREGGDDEVITIDLARLPLTVHRIVFLVSNYNAKSLASVQRLHFHLSTRASLSSPSSQEVLRVDGDDTRVAAAAMLPAMLVRSGRDGGWNVVGLNEPVAGASVLDRATSEAVVSVVRHFATAAHTPSNLRTTVGSLQPPPVRTSARPHSPTAAPPHRRGDAGTKKTFTPAATAQQGTAASSATVNPREFYTQAALVVLIAALLWHGFKLLHLI